MRVDARVDARVDRATEIEPPEKRAEMPLPRDLRSFLLTAIFTLLVFCVLYFTGEIVVPIVFAFMLNFLLQPAMRGLMRFHVPKVVAGLLIISVFIGGLIALGFTLSSPAAEWLSKAPQSLTRLEQRLSVFTKPVADMQRASKQVEKITEDPAAAVSTVTVKGPGLSSVLFSGTRTILAGFVTMALLLFFLLVSGDLFLRRLVEILPTLSDKKQAVEISHEIERNISSYLATISLMNAAVGIATGLATYFCGLSDPVLWGAAVFLLNYVPIIGPLVGVTILFSAGLLTFDSFGQALLPAGLYFAVHILEGEIATPTLLARRFTLNSVLVIISLVFWYWMWGVAGALLAVPLLATFKIICDRVRPLMAVGHFLGGETRG